MRPSSDFKKALAVIAVLAVLLAAGLVTAYYVTGDPSQQYRPAEVEITPEILQLQKYVQIRTVQGQELAGARYVQQLLTQYGVSSELIESGPGRGNVYARIRGRNRGDALMLLHHIDVVGAAPEGWDVPPWSGAIRLHWLYGRGALDMKSIGIINVHAIAEVARSGRVPERDIVFLATAGEESGGDHGMKWLLENRPDVFEGVAWVINEGGITETIGEKITHFGIETGSKAFIRVSATAATDEPLAEAARRLKPWAEPLQPERILPEVRDYFRRIAPHRIEPREKLLDIDRAVRDGTFASLHSSYRWLTQNNVYVTEPSRSETGVRMEIVMANLPDENPARRLEWLRETLAGLDVRLTPWQVTGPTKITPFRSPLTSLVAREVRAEYGKEVPVGPLILATVTTDCRYLRARAIGCYGIWPFPVDYSMTMGIHRTNERIRLDWFLQGAAVMKRVVSGWAFTRDLSELPPLP